MNQSDAGAPRRVQVRPAGFDDASFLAWVMLAAGRSHCQLGIWDMILNRPEQDCLAFLQQLATSKTRHTFHYTGFIIAEVDGRPAAALSGYDPKELGHFKELRGCWEAGRRVGITLWDWWVRNRKGISAVEAIRSDAAAGAWVVENVATLPDFRRRGLVNRLLEEILQIGLQRGFSRAQVSFLIGNAAAQKAYERCGFRVIDEKRDRYFEAETGSPGMRRLVRDL